MSESIRLIVKSPFTEELGIRYYNHNAGDSIYINSGDKESIERLQKLTSNHLGGYGAYIYYDRASLPDSVKEVIGIDETQSLTPNVFVPAGFESLEEPATPEDIEVANTLYQEAKVDIAYQDLKEVPAKVKKGKGKSPKVAVNTVPTKDEPVSEPAPLEEESVIVEEELFSQEDSDRIKEREERAKEIRELHWNQLKALAEKSGVEYDKENKEQVIQFILDKEGL
jgi:hypothetical protein